MNTKTGEVVEGTEAAIAAMEKESAMAQNFLRLYGGQVDKVRPMSAAARKLWAAKKLKDKAHRDKRRRIAKASRKRNRK